MVSVYYDRPPMAKSRRNRGRNPRHAAIIAANADLISRLEERYPGIEDCADTCCWACGYDGGETFRRAIVFASHAPTESKEKKELLDLAERSEQFIGSMKMDRAHVVPVRAGGSFDPGNFFLLCHTCHKEQPDNLSRELQIQWLFTHESYDERFWRRFKPLIETIEAEYKALDLKEDHFLTFDRSVELWEKAKQSAIAPEGVVQALILLHVQEIRDHARNLSRQDQSASSSLTVDAGEPLASSRESIIA